MSPLGGLSPCVPGRGKLSEYTNNHSAGAILERGVFRDCHDLGIPSPMNSAKPILELVVVVDHQKECSPE